MSWELHDVAIVGGGMMGRSIATKVAQEGLNVCLKEASPEKLKASRQALEASLDHDIAKFGLTNAEKKAILSRIGGIQPYYTSQSRTVKARGGTFQYFNVPNA